MRNSVFIINIFNINLQTSQKYLFSCVSQKLEWKLLKNPLINPQNQHDTHFMNTAEKRLRMRGAQKRWRGI
jgi:hypothetical protein